MSKKKVCFIVNPISGGSTKKFILEAVDKIMDAERYEWKIMPTQYAGHGGVLATMAIENGADMVVAIGGDGTINEVARSLLHTNVALGIVPCGSGNGLARHLQIPLDYSKALHLINEGHVMTIDYGLINKKPFFCTCGMGYDATVSYKFQASDKRGLLTYVENTLIGLAKYKSEVYTIVDESGKHEYKAFCVALANASQYGNNAYIAPQASMTDGLMDVTIVEPFPVVEAPQMAFMLFSGKFKDGASRIKMFRTNKIRIIREKAGVVHVDGDPMKAGKDVEVEIIPAGLKVVTNSDAESHVVPLIQTMGQQVNSMVFAPSTLAFRQARRVLLDLFKVKKS